MHRVLQIYEFVIVPTGTVGIHQFQLFTVSMDSLSLIDGGRMWRHMVVLNEAIL